ncbi:MAG: hypothetical protein KJP07_01765 [Desulfatitalea sp.]|nr:hypothetical protein [Desulfatitalea sp.]
MRLDAKIVEIQDISIIDRKEMYELMALYYDNVTAANFYKDLSEKRWVLMMRDKCNRIMGFSTMKLIDLEITGKIKKVIFSGDTIIHKDYWGQVEFLMGAALLRRARIRVEVIHIAILSTG